MWGGPAPHRRPIPPARRAAPTSSARAVQAARRTSAKRGSIATPRRAPSALLSECEPPRPGCAGAGAGAAASESAGPCDRAAPGARSLSLPLPPPRKLTGLEPSCRAQSPASQLIRPSPPGARERPLAAARGAARSGREGPAPRRPQVLRPQLRPHPAPPTPGRRPPGPGSGRRREGPGPQRGSAGPGEGEM